MKKQLNPKYLQGFLDGIEFKEVIDMRKVKEWDKKRLEPKNINKTHENDIEELIRFIQGEYDTAPEEQEDI